MEYEHLSFVEAIEELIASLPPREYSPLNMNLEDLRKQIAVAAGRDATAEDDDSPVESPDEPSDAESE